MPIHLPCNPRSPFRLPFWAKRSWSRNLDHDDLVFFETKDPYWEDQSPFDLANFPLFKQPNVLFDPKSPPPLKDENK